MVLASMMRRRQTLGRRWATAVALGWSFIAVAPCLAQEPGALPPLESSQSKSMMGGEVGFARVGEDYFTTLALLTELEFSPVYVGFQLPLKIRVIDNDPQSDHWYRDEEWDEVSDWTRILRYLQYGKPNDEFYARLGELAASSIGHGTIVSRYYNNLDIDHYYTGLATNLNLERGGAQFLVNNMMGWNLVGLRGYLRPLSFALASPGALARSFKAGMSFVSDFTAPWSIKTDALNRPRMDDENNLLFESDTAWFMGVDAEVDLYADDVVAITPYTDLNFNDLGVGWHLGLLTALKALQSEFSLRLEYRALTARYAPSYFNSLYEQEKWSFLPLANGDVVPKLRYFEEADLDGRQGIYAELFMNIQGLVGIGGAYEDYQGPDNASVMLRADLAKIRGVQLAAYYTRRNFDGASELFSLDQAMAVAQATVDIASPVYAFAAWSIRWSLDSDPNSATWGEYEGESNFDFGVGASFTF